MNDRLNEERLSLVEKLSRIFLETPQNNQELIEVLQASEKRDLLDMEALNMIEGVLQVSEIQVRDIMVPRSHMVVLEEDTAYESMLPVVNESGHSRFPVIGENRDEIEGVLLAKDLLRYVDQESRSDFDIKDVLRKAVFVPESKRLNVLLKEFRASRNHMAMVVDEYGGVAGLVTIEDVLEQIVGEIDDEHDVEEVGNIRRMGVNRYSVKALTPIEEFNEFFEGAFSEEDSDTLAGMLMKKLGHMPKRGEVITVDHYLFKIMSADSRRIKHVQLTLLPSIEKTT
ncbi:MAG: magnesium/cobalt efflux protein [endosymbiont of Galathealinum brachiosum]|uniref:Magnesium and cobalt efflux protein CorC n=1 Tax=endosymbiont of Galathealinum brachiosum TaxID=2200906 RepID=A0A370DJB1_9GAMM|nr:MAG: magnesium/cobalt efflux protein [endosymbiont of Galathealinum brachiosum]